MIYLYGDSHAEFSFRGLSLPHDCRREYSVTMYRIGRDKRVVNWRPCTPNDITVFAFGEVDCRAHVGKQIELGRNENEVISVLATEYIDTIRRTSSGRIIIVAVIPPTTSTDLMKAQPNLQARDYPYVSSDQDRLRYTHKLNARLAEICNEYSITFFNPYAPYAREDGFLKRELCDTVGLHVGNSSYVLDSFMTLIQQL